MSFLPALLRQHWRTPDDFDFVVTGTRATLLRSFWFGVYAAIVLATVLPAVLWWFFGEPVFEGMYWYWALAAAAGFVEGVVLNLVAEYTGLYRVNLLGRLKRRLSR